MKEVFGLLRDAHVVAEILTADVSRRDDPVTGQLPDVELVHRQHAFHLEENTRQCCCWDRLITGQLLN